MATETVEGMATEMVDGESRYIECQVLFGI